MKKIELTHLKFFKEFIAKIKTLPIDLYNLDYVIKSKLQYTFPPPENDALMSAVTDKDFHKKLGSFRIFFSATANPNHISETAPILELKIDDCMHQSPKGGFQFLIWLSVFPTGRIILGMEGLTLDSKGHKSEINSAKLTLEERYYQTNELISKLRIELIKMIPLTDNSIEIRDSALKTLVGSIGDN